MLLMDKRVNQLTGNFFLVGPMGAGKTTVGKQLAVLLGKTFYDSDHVIVERCGVAVTTIFEVEGEDGFRCREKEAIDHLTQLDNIVLATGGGAVLHEENRLALKNRGTVIYLRASVDAILKRTRYDKSRPLLQTSNPRERLNTLMAERDHLYKEVAHIVVDANGPTIQALMQKLMHSIQEHHQLKNP
ncbi:MAG: shikimate kinase [Neisseriaceae bacterium]|nr:shikimate kinase [Neisseriaceae bacterium]MBP6862390.1 shikimate kinase [Neisseriaceae bacterium]